MSGENPQSSSMSSKERHQQKKAAGIKRVFAQLREENLRQKLALEASKKSEIKLTEKAYIDVTTGTFNKRAADEALQSISEASLNRSDDQPRSRYAIFFLDLEQFKKYNDTNGHKAGDELLKNVGAILEKGTRTTKDRRLSDANELPNDKRAKSDRRQTDQEELDKVYHGDRTEIPETICRLGGDEFLVILPLAPHVTREKVEDIAHGLQRALKAEISVGASMGGIIVTPPDTYEDSAAQDEWLKTVLDLADLAMYCNKAERRARTDREGRISEDYSIIVPIFHGIHDPDIKQKQDYYGANKDVLKRLEASGPAPLPPPPQFSPGQTPPPAPI
jgi:GGDEF domain-containing protein